VSEPVTTTQLARDLHAAAAAWIETVRGSDGALHAAASQPVIDAAIAALHAAVSINPENPYHLEQLAMLHHNRGRLDLARGLYAIVNRLDQPATPEERQAAAIARNCPIGPDHVSRMLRPAGRCGTASSGRTAHRVPCVLGG